MSSGNADRLGGEHQSSGARDVSGQSDIGKMKTEKDGTFARKASTFRDTVAPGGKFPPEKGRYRLYVSYACRERPSGRTAIERL
jgi:glutathionyl-hydroquinone reductase